MDNTGFKFRQESQGLGYTRLHTDGFGFVRDAGGELNISTYVASRSFSISTDDASLMSINTGGKLVTE